MTPASNSSLASGPGLFHTDLSLPGMRRGKVRDVYDLPDSRLLIVASDRISAFDVVMPTPVAGKGRLLTRLSLFWLRFIESRGLARTHLLSDAVGDIPTSAFKGSTRAIDLEGRVMIGRNCRVVPIECVVRGYLEGSGWSEYKSTGKVCGIALPPGLRQCDRLPQPIFTPATKEELGKHDENIDFATACAKVGEPAMNKLRDMSIAIYNAASEHARSRGIIIADTKFEFGIPESGGDPIVIDEALTPDSSRFWPADTYAPGKAQRSFDKQYLREYLQDLVDRGLWNKQAPGPELPDAIVNATVEKYREACERLV
ncbi:MAG: phosphoribosylaminoimidazolesuccinocarboxamide synthase [Phycisphaerales bacterium]|nr:phosphoribosylaminoimidazolesuccinocarboxamide synthase [Phycisphaerales bacterium]